MSKKITVSKAIREGLLEEMRRDDKMFIMGEDMAVMGNVFAITTGRVRPQPCHRHPHFRGGLPGYGRWRCHARHASLRGADV